VEYIENKPMEKNEPIPAQPVDDEEIPQTIENDIDRDTEFDLSKYERYDVDTEVADISSMDTKRIVFYLRPQTIINTNSWKLYVFKAKIKKWSAQEIDRWALKIIEGKGIPPINLVWDGISSDGRLLPSGKYYFILTAVDQQGRNFATGWNKFNLE
jgi:hypothetical protein